MYNNFTAQKLIYEGMVSENLLSLVESGLFEINLPDWFKSARRRCRICTSLTWGFVFIMLDR